MLRSGALVAAGAPFPPLCSSDFQGGTHPWESPEGSSYMGAGSLPHRDTTLAWPMERICWGGGCKPSGFWEVGAWAARGVFEAPGREWQSQSGQLPALEQVSQPLFSSLLSLFLTPGTVPSLAWALPGGCDPVQGLSCLQYTERQTLSAC